MKVSTSKKKIKSLLFYPKINISYFFTYKNQADLPFH